MSASDPINEQEAVDWLARQLGCGVVVVELTEEHVRDAFYEAIRWWVSRRGLIKKFDLDMTSGKVDYDLPEDVDVVVDVIFQGATYDIAMSYAGGSYNIYDFDYDGIRSLSGIPGGMFYGTLAEIMMMSETGRRVISAERAWDYDKARNVLQIFPSSKYSGRAVVYYLSNKLNVDDPDNEFAKLMVRDRDLILRYAKAALKETLGRIRGKYSGGVPSANGTVSLDGDVLLGEAQQEKEALNMEIMGMSDPVPMIIG